MNPDINDIVSTSKEITSTECGCSFQWPNNSSSLFPLDVGRPVQMFAICRGSCVFIVMEYNQLNHGKQDVHIVYTLYVVLLDAII